MISLVIIILVILVITALLIWATDQVCGALNMPRPVPVLIKVVIVLLACLAILDRVGWLGALR